MFLGFFSAFLGCFLLGFALFFYTLENIERAIKLDNQEKLAT